MISFSKFVAAVGSIILMALLLPRLARAEVLSVSVPFMGPGGEYVTAADRYHTYRIPGMIVAADGAILVFAEGRRGTGEDPRLDKNAPIDIVMRRSTDHGKTWEPQKVVESGFRTNGDLVDFGDPTPVLDSTTGAVFLFYGQWPDHGPRIGTHGQSADPESGNQTLWFRRSDDGGKTWSARRQVIYPDTPETTEDQLYWRFLEPGPGNGIQLRWQAEASRNGRLMIPLRRAGSTAANNQPTIAALVCYSDDQGQTWQLRDITAGVEADETEVVELADGRVLLDSRQREGDFRLRWVSGDGGATWELQQPLQIPLTKVDGSLARYSAKRAGDDRDRILFSASRGGKVLNRSRISVWTSYDEGKTFANPVEFNRAFAAYSVVQRLADGTIGLLVETGGDVEEYGAISFYRFDLDELEGKTAGQ